VTARVPDLDGRRFGSASNSAAGEVDDATVFTYHQDEDLVWAEYSGGSVRLGYLVGTRSGDELAFRYTHVNTAGDSSSGRCHSLLSLTEDGRIRMDETWEWESRPGHGVSVVEELAG